MLQRTETREGSFHSTLLWWRQHLCTSSPPTVQSAHDSEITSGLERTLGLGLVACKRFGLGRKWKLGGKLPFHPALVGTAPMRYLDTYRASSARLDDHCLTRENSKTRVSSMQKAQPRCSRKLKLEREDATPACFSGGSTHALARSLPGFRRLARRAA